VFGGPPPFGGLGGGGVGGVVPGGGAGGGAGGGVPGPLEGPPAAASGSGAAWPQPALGSAQGPGPENSGEGGEPDISLNSAMPDATSAGLKRLRSLALPVAQAPPAQGSRSGATAHGPPGAIESSARAIAPGPEASTAMSASRQAHREARLKRAPSTTWIVSVSGRT
jgi:hypothetical protein